MFQTSQIRVHERKENEGSKGAREELFLFYPDLIRETGCERGFAFGRINYLSLVAHCESVSQMLALRDFLSTHGSSWDLANLPCLLSCQLSVKAFVIH